MTYELEFESEPCCYSIFAIIVDEILISKFFLYRESLEKMAKKEKRGV